MTGIQSINFILTIKKNTFTRYNNDSSFKLYQVVEKLTNYMDMLYINFKHVFTRFGKK